MTALHLIAVLPLLIHGYVLVYVEVNLCVGGIDFRLGSREKPKILDAIIGFIQKS